MADTGSDDVVRISGVVIPMAWNNEGRITGFGIAASDETNYALASGALAESLASMLQREVAIWGRVTGDKPNQTIIVEKVEMKKGSKSAKWSLVVGALVCTGLLMSAGNFPAWAANGPAAGVKAEVKAKAPAKKASVKAKSKAKMKKSVKQSATVKSAQTALSKAGFKCSADGIMGKKTRAAIKKFQKQNKLKVTGKLDKATRSKLGV